MMLIHIMVLSSRRAQAAIISFIPEKISYIPLIIRHQISVPFQCSIIGHYRLYTTAVNSLDIHQHSLPHALMVQWNTLWIFAKHMHGTDIFILMPADKWKLTLIFSWHLHFVIRKPWQSFSIVTKINKSSQKFDITWAENWCRSFISAWWLLFSISLMKGILCWVIPHFVYHTRYLELNCMYYLLFCYYFSQNLQTKTWRMGELMHCWYKLLSVNNTFKCSSIIDQQCFSSPRNHSKNCIQRNGELTLPIPFEQLTNETVVYDAPMRVKRPVRPIIDKQKINFYFQFNYGPIMHQLMVLPIFSKV